MQIIIEGLAMAAFGNLYQLAQEPLLKELRQVRDAATSRATSPSACSRSATTTTTCRQSELRDREDFIIYACELMRNRLVGDQIADAMGWNRDEVKELVLASPVGQMFRQMLFARVVPNLKRLGLITPARARGVRAARHHPVRGRRPGGAGPRARSRLIATAAIHRGDRSRSS